MMANEEAQPKWNMTKCWHRGHAFVVHVRTVRARMGVSCYWASSSNSGPQWIMADGTVVPHGRSDNFWNAWTAAQCASDARRSIDALIASGHLLDRSGERD